MAPAPIPLPRIIPEANLDDVLQEQLEFLIDSRGRFSTSDEERNRLNRVSRILLEPFDARRVIKA